MTVLAMILSTPLSKIFVGYDDGLCTMTCRGFLLYAPSFAFAGFSIFGSSFFTALGNGPVSAAISFLRTFVFQVTTVLLLPLLLELDGVWLSVPASELLSLLVAMFFLVKLRKKYHYA